MNPQQKFINKLVGKENKLTPMSKEAQEIEMGMFRGGAKPLVRERSIDSDDFEIPEPKKKVNKMAKATEEEKKPAAKEYIRKPVNRLRSVAIEAAAKAH